MKRMILLFLLVPVFVMAQPTITFIPSDGVTLTRADVDSTLAANGLSRDSAFHAVSDAVIVGNEAFMTYLHEYGYEYEEICEIISANFPLAIAIDDWAFGCCAGLTTVDFPLATTIGNSAFWGCDSLASATFPLTTTIDDRAFGSCAGLTTVDFPLATTIGGNAFLWCESLNTVNFPSATAIGNSIFEGCKSLISANFPLVTTIEGGAFSYCIGLTTVDFPLATAIGNSAFLWCESLTTVSFPLVTTIGGTAFGGCGSLTSINFPLVTTIGGSALGGCSSLTSINFPLVTTIDPLAFTDCIRLTSVSLGTGFNTETEIVFGYSVFGGPMYNGYSLVLTPNIDLTLGEYVLPLPDTVAKIWQSTRFPEHHYHTDYVWKSISIYTGIEEEVSGQYIYYSGNNRYGLENIKEAELYDIMGNLIKKYDNEYFADLNYLSNGIYLLRYLTDNNTIKIEKIVKK